jgi:2-phosphosulfolactate phosphatase
VVIIDIFRASTAICAALHNGVEKIIPVTTIEEALAFKGKGFILASERQGMVIDGFDMGNSPQAFLNPDLIGKTIVFTTTNGTDAISAAREAKKIWIGSFINLSAIAEALIELNEETILLCAGWNNKFNLEDTVFAGALVSRVSSYLDCKSCDAAMTAEILYHSAEKDLLGFLYQSCHYNRLKHLHLEEDMEFSTHIDLAKVIPVFENGIIRAYQNS